MAAKDISSTATFTDGVPNLNMKMCYVTSPLNDDNDDWIDMANVGMTSVYMAIAVDETGITTEAVTIDGTTIVIAGQSIVKVLVIGV